MKEPSNSVSIFGEFIKGLFENFSNFARMLKTGLFAAETGEQAEINHPKSATLEGTLVSLLYCQ